MRIVVDEDIAGGRETLARLGDVRTVSGRTVRAADLADADALVVRSVTRVDAALLAGSPVRFVGTVTTGVDHVDTVWLADQGITFASAAGSNSRPVAEYILAAMLLLARRMKFDLPTKTLGVVGVGRIGSIVARWGEALGMRVVRCDPPLQRQQAAGVFASFEELAAVADIVTLHVPLTRDGVDRTLGMVDARWLASLKTGAILINTARGPVVREDDLIASIDANHLGAVALDVWLNEPDISADLARRVNIATPHIAGYSVESRERAVGMILDALAQFAGRAGGRPPRSGRSLNDVGVSPGGGWLQAVTDVVLAACGIEAIDAKLRGTMARPGKSAAFDELRRRCAERREFSNYRVRGLSGDDAAGGILGKIGFAV
jgi:erythronate-4-phosphate dehydrogenase